MLLIVGIITSCASNKWGVELPPRPVLKECQEDVPKVAQENLLKVISYATQLEIIIENMIE